MRYRTTERADQDIAQIYRHGVVSHGLAQAVRYQDGLFETFTLLANHPRLARERSEISPPVRVHPYGVHLIVFIVEGDGILIVRVVHGRQDWARWFT